MARWLWAVLLVPGSCAIVWHLDVPRDLNTIEHEVGIIAGWTDLLDHGYRSVQFLWEVHALHPRVVADCFVALHIGGVLSGFTPLANVTTVAGSFQLEYTGFSVSTHTINITLICPEDPREPVAAGSWDLEHLGKFVGATLTDMTYSFPDWCFVCYRGVAEGRVDRWLDQALTAERLRQLEEAGKPFDPHTLEIIDAIPQSPAVFLLPHADDEAIAMSGHIAEVVASGRQVFLELLTHGIADTTTTFALTDGKQSVTPHRF